MSDRFLVRDWRDRSSLVPSIQPLSNVFEAELPTVGAPLLHSEHPNNENCDERNSGHAAYVSLSSYQEYFL